MIKNNKILLGKRKKDRLYPDIWDIFGGHIEANETKEEALKRELMEELGIEVKSYDFLESYQDKEPTLGHDYVHHIFIVNIWEGTPINKNTREHESIKWFSRDETMDLKMHKEVKRIILDNIVF
ncbi:MAG: NUDIX hydrolase [Methanomassiliicoccales archaeon]|nr:MAG: NUDIX hydrolase [Methanomassiliicoccales archaeon]